MHLRVLWVYFSNLKILNRLSSSNAVWMLESPSINYKNFGRLLTKINRGFAISISKRLVWYKITTTKLKQINTKTKTNSIRAYSLQEIQAYVMKKLKIGKLSSPQTLSWSQKKLITLKIHLFRLKLLTATHRQFFIHKTMKMCN